MAETVEVEENVATRDAALDTDLSKGEAASSLVAGMDKDKADSEKEHSGEFRAGTEDISKDSNAGDKAAACSGDQVEPQPGTHIQQTTSSSGLKPEPATSEGVPNGDGENVTTPCLTGETVVEPSETAEDQPESKPGEACANVTGSSESQLDKPAEAVNASQPQTDGTAEEKAQGRREETSTGVGSNGSHLTGDGQPAPLSSQSAEGANGRSVEANTSTDSAVEQKECRIESVEPEGQAVSSTDDPVNDESVKITHGNSTPTHNDTGGGGDEEESSTTGGTEPKETAVAETSEHPGDTVATAESSTAEPAADVQKDTPASQSTGTTEQSSAGADQAASAVESPAEGTVSVPNSGRESTEGLPSASALATSSADAIAVDDGATANDPNGPVTTTAAAVDQDTTHEKDGGVCAEAKTATEGGNQRQDSGTHADDDATTATKDGSESVVANADSAVSPVAGTESLPGQEEGGSSKEESDVVTAQKAKDVSINSTEAADGPVADDCDSTAAENATGEQLSPQSKQDSLEESGTPEKQDQAEKDPPSATGEDSESGVAEQQHATTASTDDPASTGAAAEDPESAIAHQDGNEMEGKVGAVDKSSQEGTGNADKVDSSTGDGPLSNSADATSGGDKTAGPAMPVLDSAEDDKASDPAQDVPTTSAAHPPEDARQEVSPEAVSSKEHLAPAEPTTVSTEEKEAVADDATAGAGSSESGEQSAAPEIEDVKTEAQDQREETTSEPPAPPSPQSEGKQEPKTDGQGSNQLAEQLPSGEVPDGDKTTSDADGGGGGDGSSAVDTGQPAVAEQLVPDMNPASDAVHTGTEPASAQPEVPATTEDIAATEDERTSECAEPKGANLEDQSAIADEDQVDGNGQEASTSSAALPEPSQQHQPNEPDSAETRAENDLSKDGDAKPEATLQPEEEATAVAGPSAAIQEKDGQADEPTQSGEQQHGSSEESNTETVGAESKEAVPHGEEGASDSDKARQPTEQPESGSQNDDAQLPKGETSTEADAAKEPDPGCGEEPATADGSVPEGSAEKDSKTCLTEEKGTVVSSSQDEVTTAASDGQLQTENASELETKPDQGDVTDKVPPAPGGQTADTEHCSSEAANQQEGKGTTPPSEADSAGDSQLGSQEGEKNEEEVKPEPDITEEVVERTAAVGKGPAQPVVDCAANAETEAEGNEGVTNAPSSLDQETDSSKFAEQPVLDAETSKPVDNSADSKEAESDLIGGHEEGESTVPTADEQDSGQARDDKAVDGEEPRRVSSAGDASEKHTITDQASDQTSEQQPQPADPAAADTVPVSPGEDDDRADGSASATDGEPIAAVEDNTEDAGKLVTVEADLEQSQATTDDAKTAPTEGVFASEGDQAEVKAADTSQAVSEEPAAAIVREENTGSASDSVDPVAASQAEGESASEPTEHAGEAASSEAVTATPEPSKGVEIDEDQQPAKGEDATNDQGVVADESKPSPESLISDSASVDHQEEGKVALAADPATEVQTGDENAVDESPATTDATCDPASSTVVEDRDENDPDGKGPDQEEGQELPTSPAAITGGSTAEVIPRAKEGEQKTDGNEQGSRGDKPEKVVPHDSQKEAGEEPVAQIPSNAEGSDSGVADKPESAEATGDGAVVADSPVAETGETKPEEQPDADTEEKANEEPEDTKPSEQLAAQAETTSVSSAAYSTTFEEDDQDGVAEKGNDSQVDGSEKETESTHSAASLSSKPESSTDAPKSVDGDAASQKHTDDDAEKAEGSDTEDATGPKSDPEVSPRANSDSESDRHGSPTSQRSARTPSQNSSHSSLASTGKEEQAQDDYSDADAAGSEVTLKDSDAQGAAASDQPEECAEQSSEVEEQPKETSATEKLSEPAVDESSEQESAGKEPDPQQPSEADEAAMPVDKTDTHTDADDEKAADSESSEPAIMVSSTGEQLQLQLDETDIAVENADNGTETPRVAKAAEPTTETVIDGESQPAEDATHAVTKATEHANEEVLTASDAQPLPEVLQQREADGTTVQSAAVQDGVTDNATRLPNSDAVADVRGPGSDQPAAACEEESSPSKASAEIESAQEASIVAVEEKVVETSTRAPSIADTAAQITPRSCKKVEPKTAEERQHDEDDVAPLSRAASDASRASSQREERELKRRQSVSDHIKTTTLLQHQRQQEEKLQALAYATSPRRPPLVLPIAEKKSPAPTDIKPTPPSHAKPKNLFQRKSVSRRKPAAAAASKPYLEGMKMSPSATDGQSPAPAVSSSTPTRPTSSPAGRKTDDRSPTAFVSRRRRLPSTPPHPPFLMSKSATTTPRVPPLRLGSDSLASEDVIVPLPPLGSPPKYRRMNRRRTKSAVPLGTQAIVSPPTSPSDGVSTYELRRLTTRVRSQSARMLKTTHGLSGRMPATSPQRPFRPDTHNCFVNYCDTHVAEFLLERGDQKDSRPAKSRVTSLGIEEPQRDLRMQRDVLFTPTDAWGIHKRSGPSYPEPGHRRLPSPPSPSQPTLSRSSVPATPAASMAKAESSVPLTTRRSPTLLPPVLSPTTPTNRTVPRLNGATPSMRPAGERYSVNSLTAADIPDFRRELRGLNARLRKKREPKEFQNAVVDWQRLELDTMKAEDREYCKSAALTYYSSTPGAAKASKYMSQTL